MLRYDLRLKLSLGYKNNWLTISFFFSFFFCCLNQFQQKKFQSNLLLLINVLMVYPPKYIKEYHHHYSYDQGYEDYWNHLWKTDLLESFPRDFHYFLLKNSLSKWNLLEIFHLNDWFKPIWVAPYSFICHLNEVLEVFRRFRFFELALYLRTSNYRNVKEGLAFTFHT